METKEELVTNIREWLKIETEFSRLQKEIKELRNKKKILTDSLVNVMKKNEIDCFDIKGGALVYKKSTTKKPINGKSLFAVLQTYFSADASKAQDLTKFILENREEQIKETIKMKLEKP
jgi:predicted  nucleic acid-binding Zn-ribbon protein